MEARRRIVAAWGAALLLVTVARGQFVDFSGRAATIDSLRGSAVADFTGDGNVDLALLEGIATASIRLFPGDGGGALGAPLTSVVGYMGAASSSITLDPVELAYGDMDQDGDLDLVTACTGTGNCFTAVGLNDGSGHFTMVYSAMPSVAVERGCAVGDADADGDLDLFVLSGSSLGQVLVMINDGAGGMSLGSAAPAQNTSLVATIVFNADQVDLVVGDFDGDGAADCAVANGSWVGLTGPLFGNGNSNSVTILLNDGSGALSVAQTVATGSNFVNGIAVGDLDGDGDLDLATSSFGSTPVNDGAVSVMSNDGSGGFSNSAVITNGFHPSRVELGDTDGDGDLDIVSRGWDMAFFVLGATNSTLITTENLGAGFGAGPVTVLPSNMPTILVGAGDFDGDGAGDAALAGSSVVGLALTSAFTQATYPGSGDDLELASGLGTMLSSTPPNDVWTAPLGSTVVMHLNSVAGTFVGDQHLLAVTEIDPSFTQSPLFGLPDVWVNPLVNSYIASNGALPAGGVMTQQPLPFWLHGRTFLTQGFVLSSLAQNGAYAATDAHQVTVN